MATTKAPDPRDFTSWEQAFAYPVPVVRRLEQQLRSSIAENKDKLRSLVGASYRDVLGTADRIVEMDAEMQRLESVLGGVGRRCNASAIERVAGNQRVLASAQREGVKGRRKVGAELGLLGRVIEVARRLLREGGSVLVVAKLLVLARLLHGSLAKGGEKIVVLDALRAKLAGLRRKLLAAVERQVADVRVEKTMLVDLLTAFSLATSSTPTDVLRHFLHVRQSTLEELSARATEGRQGVVIESLDLLFSTLKQVQTLFPKRMADGLARLKACPLIQDEDVGSIPELDLDVYERWIADDIRKYTPWPRHDELQGSQVRQMLEPWTTTATGKVLEGVRLSLSAIEDPSKVVTIRQDVVRHVQAAGRELAGLDRERMLEELRRVFLEKLNTTITKRSRAIYTSVEQILAGRITHETPGSLWDSSLADFDLRRGAPRLRRDIVARGLGKNTALQRLSTKLAKWSIRVEDLRRLIKDMRSTKWDEELELNEEDELETSRYQILLSREDPDALSQHLDTAVTQAFVDAFALLSKAVSDMSDGTDDGERYLFLLRLTREVKHHPNIPKDMESQHDLTEKLYAAAAKHVIDRSLAYLRKFVNANTNIPLNNTPALTLWEGNPQLPVQPSPACMRLLNELRKAMQNAGPDLWTKPAVDAVKKDVQRKIADSIRKLITDAPDPAVDGTKPDDTTGVPNVTTDPPQKNGGAAQDGVNAEDASPANEQNETDERATPAPGITQSTDDAVLKQTQIATQTLYDVLYLQKLLATHAAQRGEITELNSVVERLREKARVESAELERLQKSSLDYFKRTYLLFGILSPP